MKGSDIMSRNTSYIGLKFFNMKGEIVRIKSVRNSHLFIVEDQYGKTIKIKRSILESEYIKLRPSGIVSIFEVKLENGNKDVICTLHRAMDLDKGLEIPYMAARCSIINMFAAPFENDIMRIPLGLCMSHKTCPSNVDFKIMLDNKGIVTSSIISIYIDDTIESILKFVNTINYDTIIERTQRKLDPLKMKNLGSNLREFLDNNGWMDEFNISYNIINLNNNLLSLNNNVMNSNIMQIQSIVEKEIGYKIIIQDIIQYNESIDLTRIEGRDNEYIYLRNNNTDNSIYILKFIKGEKILRIPVNQKEYALELINRMNKNTNL